MGPHFISKKFFSTFQTIVMDAILFVISFFFLNFFLYQNISKCKNFHITTKYLILPLQNFADFHMKIKMINFEASFNVKFSFEYLNTFDWLRQEVISTLICSLFHSWSARHFSRCNLKALRYQSENFAKCLTLKLFQVFPDIFL